jgi:hypothetical protein
MIFIVNVISSSCSHNDDLQAFNQLQLNINWY